MLMMVFEEKVQEKIKEIWKGFTEDVEFGESFFYPLIKIRADKEKTITTIEFFCKWKSYDIRIYEKSLNKMIHLIPHTIHKRIDETIKILGWLENE